MTDSTPAVSEALARLTERPMGIADYEVDADDIAAIRAHIATLEAALADARRDAERMSGRLADTLDELLADECGWINLANGRFYGSRELFLKIRDDVPLNVRDAAMSGGKGEG